MKEDEKIEFPARARSMLTKLRTADQYELQDFFDVT